jgi:hypothetical protein
MSLDDERAELWRALRDQVAAIEGDLLAMKGRVTDLDDGQLEILRLLAENTKVTQHVSAGTSELIEFFSAMKGAFKVMGWIGALAKPMGAIVALFASVAVGWSAFKGWISR